MPFVAHPSDDIAAIREELAARRPESVPTHVSIRPLALLESVDIAAWKHLARHAAEPNPFQEPEFVLPLAESRLLDEPLQILTVQEAATGPWIAACVFQSFAPTLIRPLPHLRSLSSPYSFLDSPLLHREHVSRAARAALSHLKHQRSWHGIRFRVQKSDGLQADGWRHEARQLGLSVDCDRTWKRAVANVAEFDRDSVLINCSRSRRKSLLRARRWLEAEGALSHRLVTPEPGDRQACETFLALEARGWKGRTGTAIARRQPDLAFFLDMIDRFAAERRVVFGELLVGDKVFASTCNLVSGPVLFAFKLGWDPAFARGNPGHWAEIELAAALAAERPDITTIDSCAQQGSYVESVFSGAQKMESTVCVWSRRASALCEVRRHIRSLKGRLTMSDPPTDALPD